MGTSHNVLWAVSLSNGEQAHEGKGAYEEIPGELSPWQQLLVYLQAKDLHITALWLWQDDGHKWILPGATDPGLTRAHSTQPTGFKMFRGIKSTAMGTPTKPLLYTVASAEFGNTTVEIWVSESNHKRSWVVVRDG